VAEITGSEEGILNIGESGESIIRRVIENKKIIGQLYSSSIKTDR
jgi:hypothetical protein